MAEIDHGARSDGRVGSGGRCGRCGRGGYLPSLWGEFVYDDVAQIVIDDYIHQPSHLAEVLTFRVHGHDVLDFNRPFMLLSLMVDSLLWGRIPIGLPLHKRASPHGLLGAGAAGAGRRPLTAAGSENSGRGSSDWPLLGSSMVGGDAVRGASGQ